MQNIINKLIDKQEPFSIESSTDGETRLIIPLLGESRELEIIEDGSYKIVMPSLRPFTLPKEMNFETEEEVMKYLFKEDTQ